ncbi:MAG: DUF3326 domain-containing protein [Candidatus Diapherotrites archaeon]
MADRFVAVHVVPTGVRASVGGYVGDATPATNKMAEVCDRMIVHPNVVNGVMLNCARENVLYAEGYALDRFFLGEIALREVRRNKIGVVLDKVDKKHYNFGVNQVNAVISNKGIDVVGIGETSEKVKDSVFRSEAGAFIGQIGNPEVLFSATQKLLRKGAEVICLSVKINVSHKLMKEYFRGKIPNPYGGLEAIISHAVSRKFGIPCAHAPLQLYSNKIHEFGIVDKRGAAEAVTTAYLGCVLQGLDRTPKLVPMKEAKWNDFKVTEIDALVCPYNALGGVPMLACERMGIPIIAVKENSTILGVTKEKLGLKNVVKVKKYDDAVKVLRRMARR